MFGKVCTMFSLLNELPSLISYQNANVTEALVFGLAKGKFPMMKVQGLAFCSTEEQGKYFYPFEQLLLVLRVLTA